MRAFFLILLSFLFKIYIQTKRQTEQNYECSTSPMTSYLLNTIIPLQNSHNFTNFTKALGNLVLNINGRIPKDQESLGFCNNTIYKQNSCCVPSDIDEITSVLKEKFRRPRLDDLFWGRVVGFITHNNDCYKPVFKTNATLAFTNSTNWKGLISGIEDQIVQEQKLVRGALCSLCISRSNWGSVFQESPDFKFIISPTARNNYLYNCKISLEKAQGFIFGVQSDVINAIPTFIDPNAPPKCSKLLINAMDFFTHYIPATLCGGLDCSKFCLKQLNFLLDTFETTIQTKFTISDIEDNTVQRLRLLQNQAPNIIVKTTGLNAFINDSFNDNCTIGNVTYSEYHYVAPPNATNNTNTTAHTSSSFTNVSLMIIAFILSILLI